MPTPEQIMATSTVRILIDTGKLTKIEIAHELAMSRPTLDKRIKIKDWDKLELKAIKSLF